MTGCAHLPDTVPAELLRHRAWLIWRYEPGKAGAKPLKVPYYASGKGQRRQGRQGSQIDRDQLMPYDIAVAACKRRKFAGVGFALLPEFNICAYDCDSAIDADGDIDIGLLEVCASTYTEVSPSGRGLRLFFLGQLDNSKSKNLEVFSSKGFVTVTGEHLAGSPSEVRPITPAAYALHAETFHNRPSVTQTPSVVDYRVVAALNKLDPDCPYAEWIRHGMSLHAAFGDAGLKHWDEWSAKGKKYNGIEDLKTHWRSFNADGGITGNGILAAAGEPITEPASPDEFEPIKQTKFKPIPASQYAEFQAPKWLIKGLLPKAELIVLYGAWASGKSFLALDLAMHVAQGRAWRGMRTRQGRVVYVAAEGAGGFRNRVSAYAQHHDIDLSTIPLDIIADAPNILKPTDPAALIESIGQADLIVMDTWARVTAGGDENSGQDMGVALKHCQAITRATGATIILIHHSGKDASKGARGWSGLAAAADAELEVIREAEGRILQTTKQKEGEDGGKWGFDLQSVDIGIDEDGDVITSCIVVESELPSVRVIGRAMGPVEEIVNGVIQDFAQSQTRGIEVEAIIVAAMNRIKRPSGRDTRKQHIKRAVSTICSAPASPYVLEDDGTLSVI